jgi:hypothetical protein
MATETINLNFDDPDQAPREELVTFRQTKYLMCEAPRGAVMAYRADIAAAAKYDKDGRSTAPRGEVNKAIADAEVRLLASCLFEAEAKQDDGGAPVWLKKIGKATVNGKPGSEGGKPINVSQDWVRALPDRIQQALVERLRDISGMNVAAMTAGTLRAQRDEIDRQIKDLEQGGDAKNAPESPPSSGPATSA